MVFIGFNHEKRGIRERVLNRPGFCFLCCGMQSVVPRKRGTLTAIGCAAHKAVLRPRPLELPPLRSRRAKLVARGLPVSLLII